MRQYLPLLLTGCLGAGRQLVEAPLELRVDLGGAQLDVARITVADVIIEDGDGLVVGTWIGSFEGPVTEAGLPGVLQVYEGEATVARWRVDGLVLSGRRANGTPVEIDLAAPVEVGGVPVDWELEDREPPARFAWTLDLGAVLLSGVEEQLAEPTVWTLSAVPSEEDP